MCWTENLPGAVDAAVSQEVADGIADRGIVDVGGRAKVSNAKLQKRWSEQKKKGRLCQSDLLAPCGARESNKHVPGSH